MSRGLILAAPASGSGKTVITLALLRHLRRTGLRIASAKAGPDYIDPAFHTAASGRDCLNLDAWAMRPPTLAAAVGALATDAELIVCEGVMGLFDGIGADGAGSTACLAEATGWPVVLVLDVAGQSASAAAVLAGFTRFRPGVRLVGALLNRVGSKSHADTIVEACRRAVPEVPVLGAVPRSPELVLPDRHLGLVQAREHPDLDAFLDRAAAVVGEAVDAAALIRLARQCALAAAIGPPPLPPLGQRIAVAADLAFAFAYPLLLTAWRRAGAEICPFSPLAGEAPDATADAVYLPGGYPELHAERLAATAAWREGLAAAAARGAALYGECGGYMALGRGLVDAAGRRHAMAGLLPLETSFASRRLHLGYRQLRAVTGTPLGAVGSRYRCHEFHYALVLAEGDGQALFDAGDALGRGLGPCGRRSGSVFGSFVHLIDAVTTP